MNVENPSVPALLLSPFTYVCSLSHISAHSLTFTSFCIQAFYIAHLVEYEILIIQVVGLSPMLAKRFWHCRKLDQMTHLVCSNSTILRFYHTHTHQLVPCLSLPLPQVTHDFLHTSTHFSVCHRILPLPHNAGMRANTNHSSHTPIHGPKMLKIFASVVFFCL